MPWCGMAGRIVRGMDLSRLRRFRPARGVETWHEDSPSFAE